MTVTQWLEMTSADATRRGLPELVPLLEALARATEVLRRAEWNEEEQKSGVRSQKSEGSTHNP